MARRGTLRIYLGAAPRRRQDLRDADEGRRRASRGTDVVVGFVETHGRAETAAQLGDLEVVPRTPIEYRGTTFEEMDVDADPRPAARGRARRRARAHERARLANEKRWQDVEELLDAGIDVDLDA